jgi:hypothetical protein
MPGIFSGNGSVRWVIEARNIKGSPKSESKGGRKHYQDGHDETDPNGRFVITIKYPKSPVEQEALRKQLSAAATSRGAGAVTLTIPIEDVQSGHDPSTDEQIRIDW